MEEDFANMHITTSQLTDNDMLVDEYEQFNNDRTDVVVVSRSGSEEPEAEPLADDCMVPPCPLLRLIRCPSAASFPCPVFGGAVGSVSGDAELLRDTNRVQGLQSSFGRRYLICP